MFVRPRPARQSCDRPIIPRLVGRQPAGFQPACRQIAGRCLRAGQIFFCLRAPVVVLAFQLVCRTCFYQKTALLLHFIFQVRSGAGVGRSENLHRKTARGIYSCKEYIGVSWEYLVNIPIYSQNPTRNGAILAKYTLAVILRNMEYIPCNLAYEEYSECSPPCSPTRLFQLAFHVPLKFV